MKSGTYVLVALSFLAIVRLGKCNPKCYICDSLSDSNCEHPEKHKMVTQDCLPTNVADLKGMVEKTGLDKFSNLFEVVIARNDNSMPLNCLKTVAKVHDKEIIIRGCQLAPKDNLDVCKKLIEEGKDTIKHCSLCDDNGCNSAPIETMSVTLIGLLFPALAFF